MISAVEKPETAPVAEQPQTLPATISPENGGSLIRPGFTSAASFQLLKQMALIFANSHIVPTLFKANPNNALIACHMAQRMGVDPLTVMQNLYIVQGKPCWSAQFVISLWNSCGRFSPIRFEWITDGPQKGCRAYSTEIATGEKLIGTTITLKMADAEGWTKKAGSKWATMPEQMFMYRAAAFLCRAYAPELAMGLHTTDEMEDVTGQQATQITSKQLEQAVTATVGLPEIVEAKEVREEAREVTQPRNGERIQEQVRPVEPVSAEPAAPQEAKQQEAATTTQPAASMEPQPPAISTPPAEPVAVAQQATTPDDPNPIVCRETLERMAVLLKQLDPPREVYQQLLASFSVQKASQLRESEAGRVIAWTEKRLSKKQLDDWSASAVRAAGGQAIAAPFH